MKKNKKGEPEPGNSRSVSHGKKPGKELSYKDALGRLQAVVRSLESEDLPLEEAVKQYEEGVKLSRHLASILKKAEEKVVRLSRGKDGEIDLTEFGGMGENQGVF